MRAEECIHHISSTFNNYSCMPSFTHHRLDLETLQNWDLELGGREVLLKEDGIERPSVDLSRCVTHLVVWKRSGGTFNKIEES